MIVQVTVGFSRVFRFTGLKESFWCLLYDLHGMNKQTTLTYFSILSLKIYNVSCNDHRHAG